MLFTSDWLSCIIYHVLHAQSRPTLSDPADCSPTGFSVHGIFQARIPEWVAISRLLGMFYLLICMLVTGRGQGTTFKRMAWPVVV